MLNRSITRAFLAVGAGLALLAVPLTVQAASVSQVRIGNHPTFTRVVFELDAPAGYRIERQRAEDGSEEVLVTLEASSTPRSIESRSVMVERVAVQDGPRAVAHIRLKKSPSRLKELILADPPRIVFDVVFPEAQLAAIKRAAERKARELAETVPVVEPGAPAEGAGMETAEAAAPETAEAKAEPRMMQKPGPHQPKARPELPSQQATGDATAEKLAASTPRPAAKAAVPRPVPAPAPKPAIEPVEKPTEPEAMPAEVVAAAEVAETKPAEVAVPEPAPPIGVIAAAEAKGDEMQAEEAAPDEPEKMAPDEPEETTPRPIPAPRPQAKPPEKRARAETRTVAPRPAPSGPTGGIEWSLWLAVTAGVLAVLVGATLIMRRRALPNDLDVTTLAGEDGEDASIPAGGFAMGEEAPSDAEAPSRTYEDSPSPGIAAGPGLFDDDEPEKENEMDSETPDLPMEHTASELPTQIGSMGTGPAAAGEDIVRLVRELERRTAQLETRLDESIDARERLERQVAAQAEELRVQRAAIARTQRAMRSMNRGDEEQATEPALRDPSKPSSV